MLCLKTVKLCGVGATYGLSLVERHSVDKAVRNAKHFRIFGGEQADRPITTIEQPLWTKCIQRCIKIGRKVTLMPHVPMSFGDKSRKLADNIFMLKTTICAKLVNLSAPFQ